MALPTSYTTDTLAAYMHGILGPVAGVLDWSPATNNYDEAVNDALFAYGVDDIASVTGRDNIHKLRTLARVSVWRAVVFALAAGYDFKADGGQFNRSQLHKMAADNLAAAETAALVFDPNYAVGVDVVTFKHDPYQVIDEDTRTL